MQTALVAPTRVRRLALLDALLEGMEWDPESTAALDEVGRRVEAGGVAGAGHMVNMEAPEVVNALLTEFFEELPAA